MCGPITEVDVVAVKEEVLFIEIDRYTDSTEETHCLHTVIPVHIL